MMSKSSTNSARATPCLRASSGSTSSVVRSSSEGEVDVRRASSAGMAKGTQQTSQRTSADGFASLRREKDPSKGMSERSQHASPSDQTHFLHYEKDHWEFQVKPPGLVLDVSNASMCDILAQKIRKWCPAVDIPQLVLNDDAIINVRGRTSLTFEPVKGSDAENSSRVVVWLGRDGKTVIRVTGTFFDLKPSLS